MIPPIDLVYYPYFCESCSHPCEKDSICRFEPQMPSIEELRKEFGLGDKDETNKC